LLQEFLTKKVKANLQIHPLIHTRVDFIMAEGGDEILSPEKKTRTLATLGMGWETGPALEERTGLPTAR
jgi:hypothetical protein